MSGGNIPTDQWLRGQVNLHLPGLPDHLQTVKIHPLEGLPAPALAAVEVLPTAHIQLGMPVAFPHLHSHTEETLPLSLVLTNASTVTTDAPSDVQRA